jgi:hypothetical protein
LGDDHNLVLLRTTILDAPGRYGDECATAVVLGCVEKYHATLRRRALKAGAVLATLVGWLPPLLRRRACPRITSDQDSAESLLDLVDDLLQLLRP